MLDLTVVQLMFDSSISFTSVVELDLGFLKVLGILIMLDILFLNTFMQLQNRWLKWFFLVNVFDNLIVLIQMKIGSIFIVITVGSY